MRLKLIFCLVVSLLIFNCHHKTKEAESMNEITISESADSLSEYFKIPIDSKCKWFMRAMGNAESRVPGPTDYELYAYVNFNNNSFIEQIKKECPPVNYYEDGFPIDSEICSLLGITNVVSNKELNGKVLLTGDAFNVDKKVSCPFSYGIGLILNPASIIMRAGTF